MSLLSYIKYNLQEENLQGVDKNVLLTTHKILGHCLNSNTNYPIHGYGGENYSSHILSGWSNGYVKELHKAIGQVISGNRQEGGKTPGSPGIVNYTKPKHQHALASAAYNILNGIRAQHGSPYQFGYAEPKDRMTDEEFSDHVDKLGKSFDKSVVYNSGSDTDRKLARGSRYTK